MKTKTKPSDENLADRLFPSVGAEEFSESILTIPPEQRRLHTETYDFSIGTVLDYFKKKHIFIPVFQRRYVWTQAQASRLIESLIIQCPIPVIYLNQEQDERLSVIDGNQRINAIASFNDNQFELRGLTAYPELEGMRFYELDPRFQRHILNRTLRCIVIMKDTHPQVKFDVFERLNSGAVGLNAQELRHGIYHGKLIDHVEGLAKRKEWKELLGLRNDKRMRAEEFVIRFLAFWQMRTSYRKPLAEFLNNFCEQNRNPSPEELVKFDQAFDLAIWNVNQLFGEHAFALVSQSGETLSKFNAALFDAEMVAATEIGKRIKVPAPKRNEFFKSFTSLLEKEEMQKAVTRATSDEQMVKYRLGQLSSLVSAFCHASLP